MAATEHTRTPQASKEIEYTPNQVAILQSHVDSWRGIPEVTLRSLGSNHKFLGAFEAAEQLVQLGVATFSSLSVSNYELDLAKETFKRKGGDLNAPSTSIKVGAKFSNGKSYVCGSYTANSPEIVINLTEFGVGELYRLKDLGILK